MLKPRAPGLLAIGIFMILGAPQMLFGMTIFTFVTMASFSAGRHYGEVFIVGALLVPISLVVAGIVGTANWAKPKNARICLVFGLAALVSSILFLGICVLGDIGGGDPGVIILIFAIPSVVISLIYTIIAYLFRKKGNLYRELNKLEVRKMFCSNCGTEIRPYANFCTSCGFSLHTRNTAGTLWDGSVVLKK